MDNLGLEIIGHVIVMAFLLFTIVFTLVTYILYKTKANRWLAAASLFVTIALLGLYLYHAYILGKTEGFF